MKIPKSFTVFATVVSIDFESIRLGNEGILGDCSYTDGVISLCDNFRNSPVTESCIIDTLYHEKVHILLDAMGEHELSMNEKFVEVFSKLLRQSDESIEF